MLKYKIPQIVTLTRTLSEVGYLMSLDWHLQNTKKSPQFIEIVDFVAFRLSVVLESQRCVRDSNP